MRLAETSIARRSFLKAAVPCFALAAGAVRPSQIIERGKFGEDDLPFARAQLLDLVNTERSLAGATRLELDDLACRVANQHALDMVKGNFVSHWGSDGLSPFQRYSLAGGTDAVLENVSQANNIPSVTVKAVNAELRERHAAMHAETPPNDGHRRAILAPQNTHVGFGIALDRNNLRLAETYLARYLEVNPVARQAARKATVVITGRLLNAKHLLYEVDVCYELLPTPPDAVWLRAARPYSWPEEFRALRPKAPKGSFYPDGGTGDFEWSKDGKFRVPAMLYKGAPGIYTILFWIKTAPTATAFIAAQICIRCE